MFMATLGVRGCNPIWFEVDLQAHPFDDNFWLYVLQNQIPYMFATVYNDPDFTIPISNPIQFLANGTLPIDIFFDPTQVYRLEFRQNLGLAPPSQADPLIYEVNNYVPGGGGVTPTPVVSVTSQNEITNPQFALINFASPFTTTTAGTYEIAPGWFLDLGGSGSATITQVPFTNANPTSSNAPYALHLVLSGWTTDSVILRQRFQQNGVLWTGKNVAIALTAGTGSGFTSLTGNIVDSNGGTTNVISVPVVSATLTEFTGHGLIPTPATNPNVPPVAYVEFQLLLSSTVDIFLTSFQLVVEDASTPFEPSYIQDTVDRQIDHTFHYYKDSLLREQKNSILTGWDFGLNPWQFVPTTTTNLPLFGYTADQTILFQQAYVAGGGGNNISYEQASFANNYGYQIKAVTASNQFAVAQYIDPTTVRNIWGKTLSSRVRLKATLQTTTLAVKMRLIYRASLPSTIGQNEPIASWATNGEPVFTGGWTAVAPKNDPAYIITNGNNILNFESFDLTSVPSTNANMTLGIILYTTSSMISTGTPDTIIFNTVSLVQNDFAIDVPSLTFDEVLRECQYYGQKSFLQGTVPADFVGINTGESYSFAALTGGSQLGPIIRFPSPMRATPSVILYNPVVAGNAGQIHNYTTVGDWTGSLAIVVSISANGFVTQGTNNGSAGNQVGVHWTSVAQLGT